MAIGSAGERADQQLDIKLLGPFQVTFEGEVVTGFRADSARALLVYLAMHPDTAQHRDVLAGLLWPEQPNADALRNLRTALSRLRIALHDRVAETACLAITRQTLALRRTTTRCSVDVWRLRDALTATGSHEHTSLETCDECAARLETAVRLYRDEFLSGFSLDSAPFEAWMVAERENLHWKILEVLSALAAYHLGRGSYEVALTHARRQVDLEPWREVAHRQLMRALALGGRRNAALVQFESCREILSDELGVEPEAATVRLYEQIRDGVVAPPVAPAGLGPPSRPVGVDTHVVPAVPTPSVQPAYPEIPEPERRTVTVVRVALPGSADPDAPYGAEARADLLSRLLAASQDVIARFDGEVATVDDDGFNVLFGVPVAHEADPARGVLAALAICAACATLNATAGEGAEHLEALRPRVAVDTAEVVVIPVAGRRGPGSRAVMGEAVAAVERLLAGDGPGDVRVGETAYRQVEPLFRWAPRLGYGHPQRFFVPLAARVPENKGRGVPGMVSPLVGRDRELGAFRDAIEHLHAGVGTIVTLVGEAGIGKSRLVAEVRDEVGPTVHWAEGRCLSYGGGAYAFWISLLRDLVGARPDSPPAVLAHGLQQLVRPLDAERAEATYLYAAYLLGMPLDEKTRAAVAETEGQVLQNAIFHAVETLLETVAGDRPLVIVGEDLHWADPASLALLRRALSLVDRAPVLIVTVFRPWRSHACWTLHETAARMHPHRHVDLHLQPLSAPEGEMLVHNLLLSVPGPEGGQTVEGLPAGLKRQILERGEGNPFYVEEILRSLVHAGAIRCDAATCTWEAPGDESPEGPEIGIPETLYGVLRARIDGLPAGARHVLQLAAVVGRVFSYPLLAEIADPSILDEQLVVLQREQLILERARMPEAEYSFKHQLTLEAAYEGLMTGVRRELHRRVAEALERGDPERRNAQLDLLAHHWEQAGEIARAVDYLRRAAEQATALYTYPQATAFYDRALACLDRLEPDDRALRFDVLLAREALLDRQGQRAAQADDVASLKQLGEMLGDSARQALATVREAGWRSATGDYDRAREAGEHALALYRAAADQSGEAQALRELGFTSWSAGDYRAALAYARDALALHRRLANVEGEATALHNLAEIHRSLGSPRQALGQYQDALNLYWSRQDHYRQGLTLYSMGHALREIGDPAAAAAHYQRALDDFERAGDRLMMSRVHHALAGLRWQEGALPAAIEHAHRAVEISREVGYVPGIAHSLLALSALEAQEGDLVAARGSLTRALTWLDLTGNEGELGRAQSRLHALERGEVPEELAIAPPAGWVKSHIKLAEGKVYCAFESFVATDILAAPRLIDVSP